MIDSIKDSLSILADTLEEEGWKDGFVKAKTYTIWVRNILKRLETPEILLGEHEFPTEEVNE